MEPESTMKPKTFEEKVDEIEARAKRLFALFVSLAGALALTVISLIAAWDQVVDAQDKLHEKIVAQGEKIVEQEVHLAVTDDRVDRDGAPPPDPAVAAEARAANQPPQTTP